MTKKKKEKLRSAIFGPGRKGNKNEKEWDRGVEGSSIHTSAIIHIQI